MKKLLLSTVAAATLVGSVNAGDFNTSQTTRASELGTTAVDLNVSTKIDAAVYTVGSFSGVTLMNPNVNVVFANGGSNFDLVGTPEANLSIVELNSTSGIAGGKVIAQYDSKYENTLTFTTIDANNNLAGTTMSSGKEYRIIEVNATYDVGDTLINTTAAAVNLAAGDITVGSFELDEAEGTVTATVELYSAEAVQKDTAVGTLTSTQTQMSAVFSGEMYDGQIDSTNAYLEFRANSDGNSTTDSFELNVTAADVDQDAAANGDTLTVELVSSNALNADALVYIHDITNGGSTACQVATDRLSASCDVTWAGGVNDQQNDYNVTINNAGTAIDKSTFTASVEYNFQSTATDYGSSNPLKASASAGEWTYYGYNARIPYLETGTATSFVKFNNESSQTAYVYWDVTDTLGCKASNVQAANVNASFQTYSATGDIPQQAASIFNVADIVTAANTAGATDASGASCTIGSKVRADVLVTTNRNDVTGVAMQQLATGKDRIIPIMTLDNTDTNGVPEYYSE